VLVESQVATPPGEEARLASPVSLLGTLGCPARSLERNLSLLSRSYQVQGTRLHSKPPTTTPSEERTSSRSSSPSGTAF
jgi:hypothetical protein